MFPLINASDFCDAQGANYVKGYNWIILIGHFPLMNLKKNNETAIQKLSAIAGEIAANTSCLHCTYPTSGNVLVVGQFI